MHLQLHAFRLSGLPENRFLLDASGLGTPVSYRIIRMQGRVDGGKAEAEEVQRWEDVDAGHDNGLSVFWRMLQLSDRARLYSHH